MVGAANPNRAVVFEFRTAESKPLAIELVDIFRCAAFVPIAFIDTYLLATMHADAAVAEKVRRIGKNGIDGVVFNLHEPFHAIALQDGKVRICGQ